LRANETTIFAVSNNGTNSHASLHANLNMNGGSVTNQSDERLKRNIMPSFKDSLGKFSKLEFKWYEYLENRGLADGLHHGVIAQDVLKFAPEWVVEDEQGYYSLNQSAMLMDAFKAIMQLSKKVKKLEAKEMEAETKALDITLQQYAQENAQLKYQINKLLIEKEELEKKKEADK